MNDRWTDRLGWILRIHDGCTFLRPAEIEQLLEGRLNEHRRLQFEEHAADCRSCVSLVEEHQQLQRLLDGRPATRQEQDALDAADRMLDLSPASLPSPQAPRLPSLRFVAVASGLVLALVLAGWWFTRSPQMFADVDPLAHAFLPPPAVRGSESMAAWHEAAAAWRDRDLETVVRALQGSLGGDEGSIAPDAADRWFYIGIAHLGLDRPGPAVTALRRAAELEQPFVEEDTHWFLAVALERAGKRDEACRELLLLKRLGRAYAEEAVPILRGYCR